MATDIEWTEVTLQQIRSNSNCSVWAPSGIPRVRKGYVLPPDLTRFYEICGGCNLFEGFDYSMKIVDPLNLLASNMAIVGEESPEDITDSWYIIGKAGSGEAVSIDLNPMRVGRCYDSFWDRHGVPGACPVIALSFAEFLWRMFANRGRHWYWLSKTFEGYGDAYDLGM